MKRVQSPDGQSRIEFDVHSEVGMGGPEIGVLRVNDIEVVVGGSAIGNWVWSDDSRYLAFVQFIGREPEKGGDLRIYDVFRKELLSFRQAVGLTPIFKSFSGGAVQFNDRHQTVEVPDLKSSDNRTLATRALSIVAPHGSNIAAGKKTLEVRSWRPESLPIRDLLIVENANFLSADSPVDPDGTAVAIVDVEEVHEWQPSEVEAACSSGWVPGYWAWSLSNVRPVTNGATLPAKRKLYEVELVHEAD